MRHLRLGALSILLVDGDPYCPVRTCDAKKKPSFLQLSEPNLPLWQDVSAPEGLNHKVDPDTGISKYDLVYNPAHFTCMSCDQSACPDCNVVCDIKECIGKFYTQECWCRRDRDTKLGTEKRPLWQFRKEDSRFLIDDHVLRFHCDDDCTGGMCSSPNIQCAPRKKACQPWWWCEGEDPPKEAADLVNWPDGKSWLSALQMSQQSRKLMTLKKPKEFEKNDIGKFSFKPGRWSCGKAALPPKVRNPDTFAWMARGYIVFEKSSCTEMSPLDTQCHCWDNAVYESGTYPVVSEFTCDRYCGVGPCEKGGQLCDLSPPDPIVTTTVAPINPIEREEQLAGRLNVMREKVIGG